MISGSSLSSIPSLERVSAELRANLILRLLLSHLLAHNALYLGVYVIHTIFITLLLSTGRREK